MFNRHVNTTIKGHWLDRENPMPAYTKVIVLYVFFQCPGFKSPRIDK
jgi:hypothetical protein